MNRRSLIVLGVVLALLAGVLQGQSGLEIRAADTNPVSGWQQMAAPGGDRMLWVAPTNQLTSVDIERAERSAGADGSPAVTLVFTAEGTKKMAAASAAQLGKPMVMLLDGKVIWAPIVRSAIEKEAVLTGGPGGLSPEQVQRLLASLKRR